MRKGFAILCGLGILMLAASPLYAGGIINKSNQSADYMRTLNRSAATDYPDIAVFNPAGIMQMENGAYAKLDAMYFAKDYSNDRTEQCLCAVQPAFRRAEPGQVLDHSGLLRRLQAVKAGPVSSPSRSGRRRRARIQ